MTSVRAIVAPTETTTVAFLCVFVIFSPFLSMRYCLIAVAGLVLNAGGIFLCFYIFTVCGGHTTVRLLAYTFTSSWGRLIIWLSSDVTVYYPVIGCFIMFCVVLIMLCRCLAIGLMWVAVSRKLFVLI